MPDEHSVFRVGDVSTHGGFRGLRVALSYRFDHRPMLRQNAILPLWRVEHRERAGKLDTKCNLLSQ